MRGSIWQGTRTPDGRVLAEKGWIFACPECCYQMVYLSEENAQVGAVLHCKCAGGTDHDRVLLDLLAESSPPVLELERRRGMSADNGGCPLSWSDLDRPFTIDPSGFSQSMVVLRPVLCVHCGWAVGLDVQGKWWHYDEDDDDLEPFEVCWDHHTGETFVATAPDEYSASLSESQS